MHFTFLLRDVSARRLLPDRLQSPGQHHKVELAIGYCLGPKREDQQR